MKLNKKQNKRVDLIDDILFTIFIQFGGAIFIYYGFFRDINRLAGLLFSILWIICVGSIINQRREKKGNSLFVILPEMWYYLTEKKEGE